MVHIAELDQLRDYDADTVLKQNKKFYRIMSVTKKLHINLFQGLATTKPQKGACIRYKKGLFLLLTA